VGVQGHQQRSRTAGFFFNQDVSSTAYKNYFATLKRLDGMLTDKQFLTGDRVTEANLRLFPVCFDTTPSTIFDSSSIWCNCEILQPLAIDGRRETGRRLRCINPKYTSHASELACYQYVVRPNYWLFTSPYLSRPLTVFQITFRILVLMHIQHSFYWENLYTHKHTHKRGRRDARPDGSY
jgi:hypothetical protein